ncbi:MAG: Gldg family protein [Anaerovoracaceae bacterium]|jgi:ABC-2 type transport system permease protein
MKKPDIKGAFGTKSTRYGSYSAAMIAIVIAVVVVVNLFAAALPSKIKTYDLSENKVYSIGNSTKKILKNLDSDITITVLSSKENADETLKELLDKYADYDHIDVVYEDPSVNVSLANEYSSLSEGSLIVTCGDREQTIDSSSLYSTDYSSGSYSSSFDGEGQITSAVQYVTSTDLPKMYTITGHGESEMSSTVSSLVKKQNIETEDLNLMTSGGIPDDCDVLFIYAPTSDYTADEAQQVIDYLDNGGSVVIMANYTDADMTNFKSILTAYGLNLEDGIVMETANHYYQYPMYVIPTIADSDITSDLADENANILMPDALGMTETDASGVTITPLLQTSDGAYLKTVTDGKITTTEKEDGDTVGQFDVAALAEKDSGDNTGKLVVITASSLIDDSVTQSFTLGNLDFFTSCLSYLTSDDGSDTVSISSKSLSPTYITVNALQSVIWGAVTIIIIPVVIIVIGLVVWLSRRKK